MRLCTLALLSTVVVAGCGDEEVPKTAQRGAPKMEGGGAAKKGPGGAPKTGGAPGQAADGQGEQPEQGAARPPPPLDSKTFVRIRDPFQSFQAEDLIVPDPVRPKAERPVRMSQYAFSDLKLIAIVNSGRGILPRALFLASDGKSGTIKQGEYFSSAEVLLAAVNRDYVEIEVVDDDLASSLNLQRGERRAIYLRNE